ncbi:hypothetical protein AWJ14_07690 [Hoeflea olei]|uniref:Transcriptional regulator LacI/GalR-like sensor domain-containing protein n=1 Tax=Hoeflea olei TaxID=1480615 RepID=A0A1C1YU06_9HYPH|nr:hypothetical protein AWJ14_07690 [Hoeflea olei]
MVPSINNPVYAEAVQGLQEVATRNAHQILLSCTGYDIKQELAAVKTLIGKRVDGLILTMSDASRSEAVKLIRSRKLPYCLLFNHEPGAPSNAAVDNALAAYQAGKAFAEHGHRALGFVTLRLKQSDRARQRLEGLSAACRDFDLPAPVLLEIEEQARDIDSKLAAFLAGNPMISGIFASNDLMALDLMASLRRLGLVVPDDISVIGFDGISFGQMMQPTLATIVTDPYAMGQASAEMVLSSISKTASPAPAPKAAQFRFRPGGSIGAAAERGMLTKKLQLLRQRSLARAKQETSKQER